MAEFFEHFARFAVSHAAAANHHRLFRGQQDRHKVVYLLFGGGNAGNFMDALLQEFIGEIVGFTLNILRHGNADRARFGGIGQHAHRVYHRSHQLFGAGNSVPIPCDGFIRVIGGNGKGIDLLKLLEYRVGLTGGKRVGGN